MRVFFTPKSLVFHSSLECCSLKRHDRGQVVHVATGQVATKVGITRKPCDHCHRFSVG